MTIANVHFAKTNLSKLIDAALRGEEVVIARNGTPTVKLVPVDGKKRLIPGAWRGAVKVHDPEWWKADDELADLFGIGPAVSVPDDPSAR